VLIRTGGEDRDPVRAEYACGGNEVIRHRLQVVPGGGYEQVTVLVFRYKCGE
jgi:hypothetical protein